MGILAEGSHAQAAGTEVLKCTKSGMPRLREAGANCARGVATDGEQRLVVIDAGRQTAPTCHGAQQMHSLRR